MGKVKVTVSMDLDLLEQVDAYAKSDTRGNRSFAIHQLCRIALKGLGAEK